LKKKNTKELGKREIKFFQVQKDKVTEKERSRKNDENFLGSFHRITGWKRPLRSSSPTIHPTAPFLLNHVLKCHIHMFFKHLRGW